MNIGAAWLEQRAATFCHYCRGCGTDPFLAASTSDADRGRSSGICCSGEGSRGNLQRISGMGIYRAEPYQNRIRIPLSPTHGHWISCGWNPVTTLL